MTILNIAAGVAAMFLLSPSKSLASPWNQKENELLIITRGEIFQATLEPINSEMGLLKSRFERIESNTYVEYGINNRLMIGGKALYGTSWLTKGETIESASGFSEIEAFGQYQVWRNQKHAVAVRSAILFPARFQSGARPELQDEGTATDFSLLYGWDITAAPVKLFAATEIGYRKSFGDAADIVRTQSTLGVEPYPQFLVLIDSFTSVSMRNSKLAGSDFDVYKIQPSIVWRPDSSWSIQAGFNHEYAGRNIARGQTFFLGLWTRF